MEFLRRGMPDDAEAALWKARFEEAFEESEKLRAELTQRDWEETALMHEAEQVPRLQRELEQERTRAVEYSHELSELRALTTAEAAEKI